MSEFWACWKIFTGLISIMKVNFEWIFPKGLTDTSLRLKKKKTCWSLQTQMNSMRCPVLSFYFVSDLLSVKTFWKSFPTSSWCKICLSFSSSNFISGAIWNRLTSPRLMFTDHSGSWLWALISLILPPLKTTLNGSCKVFNILSSIAVCSCCLGSWSFPVTWWNEMFSN